MSLFILTTITLYILLELIVLFIIFFEKNNIPWLITNIDKYPVLDNDGLKKFTDTSFHPKLGWWRPPLSYGEEKGVNGKVFFSIDSDGSRKKLFNTLPSKIATFGDSFAFCRQVNDDQTWQSNLAKKFNINIQNFGVGNFGLDQALLRYSLCELSNDTELIIVMFVPETICRIQSQWKHYLEFGNTFAFKPIFKIINHEELIEISNPMKGLKDFKNYRLHLKNIQKNDRFYNEKFKPSIIRFPFLLNDFKYMNFKFKLIKYAFIRIWTKIFKKSTNKIDEQIMKYVMKCNLKQSYALYNENKSTQLLTMLFRKFKHKVTLKNKKVVFIVAPQLLDLELRKDMNELPYEKFYKKLKTEFNVIDLTQDLSILPLEKLYVNDIYGGHFSVYGNDAVAKLLEKKIELK